jgi:hypothetical protein
LHVYDDLQSSQLEICPIDQQTSAEAGLSTCAYFNQTTSCVGGYRDERAGRAPL